MKLEFYEVEICVYCRGSPCVCPAWVTGLRDADWAAEAYLRGSMTYSELNNVLPLDPANGRVRCCRQGYFGEVHLCEKSVRVFETGATRDTDEDKHDFEGFISPLVVARFGEYMHKNRHLANGQVRDSDNWQAGIPLATYMKSGWRHFFDWWLGHRNFKAREGIEDALCGLLFNLQGYLHETLKKRGYLQ